MLTIGKIVLAGVLSALAGGQAWAISISSCPFGIGAAGNYVVTADLTCNGDGIDITASNVSVNLNGHIIQSVAGVLPGIGINVYPAVPAPSVNHIGISGPGLIRGFATGISIVNANYVQVSLTAVAGNLDGGIYAANVIGLTVGANVMARNAAFGGLLLLNSTGAQVTGNQAVGNTTGIWLGSGDSNALSGNVANGNSQSGILLGAGGIIVSLTNSRVSSNTTNGNGVSGTGSGIQVTALVAGSYGNEIFSNTSSVGNISWDLEDDNAPPPCGTDYWRGNVHFTQNVACVD